MKTDDQAALAVVTLLSVSVCANLTSAGTILPHEDLITATPGSQISVRLMLEDTAAPLFGYSLAFGRVSGDAGMVVADASASSLEGPRNLITAAGKLLDPVFTTIQPAADDGVFISTNTADFSTVESVEGVNDMLAEIVFTIDEDALGDFVFDLGPGSALSDAAGFPVDFVSVPVTLRVLPAPATAAAVLSVAVLTRRRRG